MVHQVRVLATKPDGQSLRSGLTGRKQWTNSYKLPFDLYMCDLYTINELCNFLNWETIRINK